jgi:hypothetical protein
MLNASEGYLLTMKVNGAKTEIKAGKTYTGNIVLTLRKKIKPIYNNDTIRELQPCNSRISKLKGTGPDVWRAEVFRDQVRYAVRILVEKASEAECAYR